MFCDELPPRAGPCEEVAQECKPQNALPIPRDILANNDKGPCSSMKTMVLIGALPEILKML